MRLSSSTPRRTTAWSVGLAALMPGLLWLPVPATAAVDAGRSIQIVASNDFHGRLATAPALAGALGEYRAEDPDLLFVGVGDILGASPFDSAVAQDRPTIEVMNALGMEVSAVGNHEYDAGHDDLTQRVLAPHHREQNPFGGADWPYLGANLRDAAGRHALAQADRGRDGATWITEVDGVEVGFVGVVTESLPWVVSPAALRGIEVTDAVAEANRAAAELTAAGADVVVLLAHEGAVGTAEADMTRPGTAFARIVDGASDDVDAILSGHTHLTYAHEIDGRPVLSAGAYGTHLARLVLQVDPTRDEVEVALSEIVRPESITATAPDALALREEIEGIVATATEQADELGSQVLGSIAAPARRAVTSLGFENRGAESTASNLVAESHRWATSSPEQGAAQIAFMNPGGVRADLTGDASNGYPAPITLREAAIVQPFANTLINMDLTGAQLKAVLEEQWQVDADGAALPGRPVRHLGTSRGFRWTYDPTRGQGNRITGMWLHRARVEPEQTYSVTVHEFLAAGGDAFTTFTRGTRRVDTGQTDLMATTAYLGAHQPAAVDTTQHSVGVVAPEQVTPGERIRVDVSSWSFTAPGSLQDDVVELWANGTRLASAPLDHSVDATPTDESGRAALEVTVPAEARGTLDWELRGAATGTTAHLSVQVVAAPVVERRPVTLEITGATRAVVQNRGPQIRLTVAGSMAGQPPTGTVALRRAGRTVRTVTLRDGSATLRLPRARALGAHTWTFRYSGDGENMPATLRHRLRSVRMAPRLTLRAPAHVRVGKKVPLTVRAVAPGRIGAPRVLGGKVTLHLRWSAPDGEVRQQRHTLRLVQGRAQLLVSPNWHGRGTLHVVARRAPHRFTRAATAERSVDVR